VDPGRVLNFLADINKKILTLEPFSARVAPIVVHCSAGEEEYSGLLKNYANLFKSYLINLRTAKKMKRRKK